MIEIEVSKILHYKFCHSVTSASYIVFAMRVRYPCMSIDSEHCGEAGIKNDGRKQ